MQARRVRGFSLAILLATVASPVVAQRTDTNKPAARPSLEQADVQALVQTVELAMLADVGISVPAPGAPPPATPPVAKPLTFGAPDSSQGEVPVKWVSNHFIKGQTDTYVPFTIQVDKAALAAGAAMWIRVVNAEQAAAFAASVTNPPPAPARQGNNRNQAPPAPVRTTFAWEGGNSADVPDGGRLSRAIQLRPGQYVAYIAVKEKSAAPPAANQRGGNNRNDRNAPPAPAAPAAGKVGLLRHEITVPDYGAAELTTSSVIVAQAIEQVTSPPADQESNPYIFGPLRIVPSSDGRFAKSGELNVIFWIYGVQSAATGKPDVTIDYNFYQRLAEGEKYFNKTSPEQLNAQTLPPEFNMAAGHQLTGSRAIPLTSFPAADYRLEIKIMDKTSGKSVTQNVTFTVLPV